MYSKISCRACSRVLKSRPQISSFDCCEEAFRHRVVPAVSLAAHARYHAVAGHHIAVSVRRIQPATIGVVNQSGCRPTRRNRHAQCAQDPSDIVARRHRPAHHAPRVQIQQHREIEPACVTEIFVPGPPRLRFLYIFFITVQRILRFPRILTSCRYPPDSVLSEPSV